MGQERATPHAGENEEVEEVHDSEDDQNKADLEGEELHRILKAGRLASVFEGECDVTDVDQVETHHEKVIDRVGQGFIASETLYQEKAPVPMERARHPPCQHNADGEIGDVGPNGVVEVDGESGQR